MNICMKLNLSLAISIILSHSTIYSMQLCNKEDRVSQSVLKGHTGKVSSVAFYEDKIVTGSADKTVKIWDKNTGQVLYTFEMPSPITTAYIMNQTNFFQTNKLLVTFSNYTTSCGSFGPGLVQTWRMQEDGQVFEHTKLAGGMYAITTSGNKLIAGGDKSITVWDINTLKELITLQGHTNAVRAVAAYDDKFVTGSFDRTVKVWDIHTYESLHTFEVPMIVSSVAISKDKVVAGLYRSINKAPEKIWIWDLNTQQLLHKITAHIDNEDCYVAISNDILVSGSWGRPAHVWNANSGQLLYTLLHNNWIQSLAIEGDTVVTGSLGNALATIWKLKLEIGNQALSENDLDDLLKSREVFPIPVENSPNDLQKDTLKLFNIYMQDGFVPNGYEEDIAIGLHIDSK